MKTQVFTNPQMVRYIEENYTFEDVINALMYYDTDTYYKEEEFLSQTTIEELIKTLIDVCYESGIDVIEVLETYK